MASVARRAGLALLLAAVLIAPSFSTFRARPAHANPAAAVAAACAGPQAGICVSIALAGISLWVAYNGDSTAEMLDNVGTIVANWFNGLTNSEQSDLADRVRSGQVLVNQQMIDAWTAALDAGVLPAGFYSGSISSGFNTYSEAIGFDAGTGYASGEVVALTGWWNVPVVYNSDGVCQGYTSLAVRLQGGANSTGSGAQVRVYDALNGTYIGGGVSTVSGTLNAGQTGQTEQGAFSGAHAVSTALCSGNLWVQLALRNATGIGAAGRHVDILYGEVRVTVDQQSTKREHYYFPPHVLGVAESIAAPSGWDGAVAPGAGVFVAIPKNPDALIGESGNIVVPLADGSVGTLVGPTVSDVTVPSTAGESLVDSENAGWWEGLFGGVQGALTSIWSRLGAMADTLANIFAAVQSLVSDLILAIEGLLVDLFVPTVDPFTALGSTVAAAVPACVVQGFAGALSGMFSGGASAVTIAIGPYGNVTISDANGWVAPLRSLSSYVAYAGLLGYAVALYRRFFGGGGGS